jgi:hypothetical protein
VVLSDDTLDRLEKLHLAFVTTTSLTNTFETGQDQAITKQDFILNQARG